MSTMANTTPIVTTVTKTATKEKTLNGEESASRVNILYLCEEHYEDILPVMDKIRRDKRKEVHTRLDFGENSKKSRKMTEDSQNSSAKTLGRPHKRDSSPIRDHPRSRDRSHGIEESYGNTYPSYRTGDKHRYHSHGTGRSSCMKRGRNSESPLSRMSESVTSEGGHWKSKSKRRKPTDEEDLAVPWSCEEVDPFTPQIRNFKSSRKTRMPNNVKTYYGTGDPEDHDFMKRFKVETGRMKGAPECMRIFRFMHGVNNPELTKRLNEHVPKIVEEMMTATTAFIRGETAAASKKKVNTPWKS
nr:reverse transcriptase domain-containing protein [Tanacetum cinerariifolium]